MTPTQEIVITQFDHDRLSRLLDRVRRQELVPPAAAVALEEELERATVVAPQEIPPNVVTMNSEVRVVDLDTGQSMRLAVVFPAASAPGAGKVSVLAPLGLALLGVRAGEEIAWEMPGGVRRLRVEQIVYQPEAAGRFDL